MTGIQNNFIRTLTYFLIIYLLSVTNIFAEKVTTEMKFIKVRNDKKYGVVRVKVVKEKDKVSLSYDSQYETTSMFFFKTKYTEKLTATYLKGKMLHWRYEQTKKDRSNMLVFGHSSGNTLSVTRRFKKYSIHVACTFYETFFQRLRPNYKKMLNMTVGEIEPIKVKRVSKNADLLQTKRNKMKIMYDKNGFLQRLLISDIDGKESLIRKSVKHTPPLR